MANTAPPCLQQGYDKNYINEIPVLKKNLPFLYERKWVGCNLSIAEGYEIKQQICLYTDSYANPASSSTRLSSSLDG
jgi:hypothetical protein